VATERAQKTKRRGLVDFRLVGFLEYLRHRKLSERWGGAFNGQQARQQIVRELLQLFEFDSLVETGTYRGSSTQFLHEASGLPVYSVESNPRYHGYCQVRFRKRPEVFLHLDDSRHFLQELSRRPALQDARLFFYLDSHWLEDLPLREELVIIFENWKSPIIMIDDFKVPDDPGYDFDDYGDGKTLSLEYLEPLRRLRFAAFFPRSRAADETGARRGCVVLARDGEASTILEDARGLRRWNG
jgi:hypothetical protein